METIKFMVFSDLHVDIMHDSIKRVKEVIRVAAAEKVDFILSLGDTLYPPNDVLLRNNVQIRKDRWFYCDRDTEKHELLDLMNKCGIPFYHVIGNHDSDCCPKKVFTDYMGMEHNYYCFDIKGLRFAAIDTSYIYYDGKYIPYENRNLESLENAIYPCVPEEQLEWLKKVTQTADKPVIVLSHHQLHGEGDGVENHERVKAVINKINRDKKRIILCLTGHSHLDGIQIHNGVPYIDINSLSCHWVGDLYTHDHYNNAEMAEAYPYMSSVAPYKSPVFACYTINREGISIKGYSSEIVGPSPYELGMQENSRHYTVTAAIADRYIPFGTQ